MAACYVLQGTERCHTCALARKFWFAQTNKIFSSCTCIQLSYLDIPCLFPIWILSLVIKPYKDNCNGVELDRTRRRGTWGVGERMILKAFWGVGTLLFSSVESSYGFKNCLEYSLQIITRMFRNVLECCFIYIGDGYHGITGVEYPWTIRNPIFEALCPTTSVVNREWLIRLAAPTARFCRGPRLWAPRPGLARSLLNRSLRLRKLASVRSPICARLWAPGPADWGIYATNNKSGCGSFVGIMIYRDWSPWGT